MPDLLKKMLRFLFVDYPKLTLIIVLMAVSGFLDLRGLDSLAHALLGATSILMVFPLLWEIYETLRDGEFGVDLLAATAIITSVVLGEYWAGMVIVLMLTGGEALEDYSENRAKKELTALISNVPRIAHLVKGRNIVDIKVSAISPGQTLEVRPGEMIPVDGIIVDGESSFDESSLTGESLPVEHSKGEKVLSGSINGEAVVRLKALESSENSQYEQIIRLVKEASQTKSNFVRVADRYALPFTIISFLIAGSAWAISGEPLRFLQVLVVATPCPLILAAPIAIISGMSRAAKNGIIVKSGTALERLASARSVAFDKTGTLTKGSLKVEKISLYSNKYKREDVLKYASALEKSSNHVLATAIVNETQDKKIKPKKASTITETPGFGVSGKVGKSEVLVGKASFIKKNSIKLPQKASDISQTTVFVAVDGEVMGSITFVDELRKESKNTIVELKRLGISHLLMVSGDNQKTAKKIAREVSIQEVFADQLPVDKLKTIKNLDKKHRPVAFVGDGVNDAPVLAASDVGIAIGARGNTAASESADVVIMLDDLFKVATGVGIARRALHIGKQSIWIGIVISIGLMAVFSTGKFSPVLGAGLQEIVDVVVIINALRAHRG